MGDGDRWRVLTCARSWRRERCAWALRGCGAEEAAKDVGEAIDPVAQAAQKTVESGGARLTGDITMRLPQGDVPMVMEGAASFADDRLALTMDFPDRIAGVPPRRLDRIREESGFPMKQVNDGDVAYLSTGEIRDRGAKEGFGWIKVDLGSPAIPSRSPSRIARPRSGPWSCSASRGGRSRCRRPSGSTTAA